MAIVMGRRKEELEMFDAEIKIAMSELDDRLNNKVKALDLDEELAKMDRELEEEAKTSNE